MAVRNFWLEAEIDGRKSELRGGPANKAGGMEVTLYQRNDGGIETAVRLICTELCGNLVTDIYISGVFSGRYETKR